MNHYESMTGEELEKDSQSQNDDWDRFLPHFEKKTILRKKCNTSNQKKEYSPFPPEQPRNVDLETALEECEFKDDSEDFVEAENPEQPRKVDSETESVVIEASPQETATVVIRPAVEADVETIFHYVCELAIYEKALHEVKTDVEGIRKTMFCENSHVYGLICEKDGKAIGFAVYFYNYSTWLGKKGLYLEDLYITPSERGSGTGKKLLHHIANIAISQDCGRFEWSCLDWNEPALKFYHKQGAVGMEEWTVQRLEGEALSNFASKSL